MRLAPQPTPPKYVRSDGTKPDVNARNKAGQTALAKAAGVPTPSLAAMQHLLLAGADPNSRDNLGYTPIMLALASGVHAANNAL
jgi:ankyrin repeat protein